MEKKKEAIGKVEDPTHRKKVRVSSLVRNGEGDISLKRTIAFLGMVCLCYKFVAGGRWTDSVFFYFPLGLTILYAPQLAVTLLNIWKGKGYDRKGNN